MAAAVAAPALSSIAPNKAFAAPVRGSPQRLTGRLEKVSDRHGHVFKLTLEHGIVPPGSWSRPIRTVMVFAADAETLQVGGGAALEGCLQFGKCHDRHTGMLAKAVLLQARQV